jgi:hypothetical protein
MCSALEVFGHSRLLGVHFYPQQDLATLIQGLEACFTYLGWRAERAAVRSDALGHHTGRADRRRYAHAESRVHALRAALRLGHVLHKDEPQAASALAGHLRAPEISLFPRDVRTAIVRVLGGHLPRSDVATRSSTG